MSHLAGRLLGLPEVVEKIGRPLLLHPDDKGRLIVLLLPRDALQVFPRDHHLLLDEVGRHLKSLVEVECSDKGLEGIPRHIAVLQVDPGGDPEHPVDAHAARQLIDLLATDEEGADLCQSALILIGIEPVSGSGYHRPEEAVAEILQPLILLTAVGPGIGRVSESLSVDLPVVGLLPRHLEHKALHAPPVLVHRSHLPPGYPSPPQRLYPH